MGVWVLNMLHPTNPTNPFDPPQATNEGRCFSRFARAAAFCLLMGALTVPLARPAAPAAPEAVRLAAVGKARFPVVVAAGASERVRTAAGTLAAYLGRITGAKFDVMTGDGRTGLAVGAPGDFPALALGDLWDRKDPTRSEDYLLRSHRGGVHLIGASDLAVEHAVWDFLYRLGYRQFFPGATWEVVPRLATAEIAVDAREHPAYHARRIWYGVGLWDYNPKPYAEWCARNRAVSGIELRTGHAYDGILHRHKAEFDAHPEYLGLVGGQRKSSKFCISNPGLRRLVVEDALAQVAQDPAQQCLSLEPSDGGGWCECERCAALGSPSDRALLLANEAAEAINGKFGPKYVGMYAYNQHSPPPHIRVHPHVVISIATAFISGGYSVDQLVEGWQKQGALLGIREYYSVNTWDRDLPGAARGSKPGYLKETIPHFHAKGARFLSAESSDNWGPNGLGYYLASRMLWDVREADRLDALRADFFERAFGTAREPAQEFYRLTSGDTRPLLSDDLVGRMYRSLGEARKRTEDPSVQARLRDLLLYTRYVDLWQVYASAAGPERQKAFEALIRHAYRMRGTMMVHTKGLYRDLPARDKSVTVPAECAWNVPEGRNPWKSSEPFTAQELDGVLSAGISSHPLLAFTPVSFTRDLQPATRLALPDQPAGSVGLYSRGVRNYYTWIEKPGTLELTARAGLVYGTRGPAKLALFPSAETEGKAVATAEVPPDKTEHPVTLKTAFTGLHRIEVTDAGAGTSVAWADGTPMTVQSSPDARDSFHGRWTLYFYVPRGTQTIGGFAAGEGRLLDGSGKPVHTFERKPGYFAVPVGPRQDGKLWKFDRCSGERLLMTVPPYLARSPKELLLPADVLAKDAGK